MEGAVQPSASLAGANLSQRGQDYRLRMAILALAAGLGMTVAFAHFDFPRVWRLATVIPFWFASLGAVQGLYRTCPMHSFNGTREASDGRSLPQENMRCQKASKRMVAWVLGLSISLTLTAVATVYFLP